jgi:plastocyanin
MRTLPVGASRAGARPALVVGLVALLLGALLLVPGPIRAATPDQPSVGTVEFVNVSATTSLSFVPGSFTVQPGATVHLIVTQLADFEHTFTLSPAVNVTIPSSDTPSQVSAFFNAHPPLVNLTLGSTPGQEFFANFTAPTTLGSYEYVCLIHFPTMIGTMAVSSSTGSSSGTSPTTVELVALGVVVAIVVIVGVLVLVRRRSRGGPGAPPPSA